MRVDGVGFAPCLGRLQLSPAGGCWQARPAGLARAFVLAAVHGVRIPCWAPSAYPFPVTTSAARVRALLVVVWASSSVG